MYNSYIHTVLSRYCFYIEFTCSLYILTVIFLLVPEGGTVPYSSYNTHKNDHTNRRESGCILLDLQLTSECVDNLLLLYEVFIKVMLLSVHQLHICSVYNELHYPSIDPLFRLNYLKLLSTCIQHIS